MANDEKTSEPREQETHTSILSCPHCAQPIKINARFQVLNLSIPTRRSHTPEDWAANATEDQRAFVETVKQTGIFAPFCRVVGEVKKHELPRVMESFLITFVRTAVTKRLPKNILNMLADEFPGQRINVWTAQGIAAITTDGTIRQFFSAAHIFGSAGVRDETGGVRFRMENDLHAVREWRRTRFGFVEGTGALFQELQKRAIAEFFPLNFRR